MAERNARRALKSAEIEARRQQVASLTLHKVHQTEIARRLGVAQSTVSRDLKVIEAGWRRAAAADLAELEEMERDLLRRLDAKPGLAFRLISLRLRVKERRARLMGLDAPLRTRDETPTQANGWRVRLLKYIEQAELAAPPVEDVYLDDLSVDQQAQVNLWIVQAREQRMREAAAAKQSRLEGQGDLGRHPHQSRPSDA